MQSLCTLRGHCRQWPRNTRYQAGATLYLGRTCTGWIAPACGWRTHSITSSAATLKQVGAKETPMQRNPLRTSALALAFVGSVGLAAAQQPPPPADLQQQSQQKARARAGKPRPIGEQQTPSGKTGKEEQSSQAPNAKPEETAVFVNGALAVSGA